MNPANGSIWMFYTFSGELVFSPWIPVKVFARWFRSFSTLCLSPEPLCHQITVTIGSVSLSEFPWWGDDSHSLPGPVFETDLGATPDPGIPPFCADGASWWDVDSRVPHHTHQFQHQGMLACRHIPPEADWNCWGSIQGLRVKYQRLAHFRSRFVTKWKKARLQKIKKAPIHYIIPVDDTVHRLL